MTQTNTKQTPKSCSCRMCRWGKSRPGSKFMMKAHERSARHDVTRALHKLASQQVDDPDNPEVFHFIPTGHRYD